MKRHICITLMALLVLAMLGCQVPDPTPTTTPSIDVTPGTTAGTAPTTDPTTAPTTEPTTEATEAPTTEPSTAPTTEPTTAPTTEPTTNPTTEPPTTEPPTTEPPHTHEYKSTVFAPTCMKDGYTAYACKCGDNYTGDYVEAKGHDYETEVIAPTTTSQGYTVYTCSECGYSFKDDYTEKLPEPTDPPCEHEYTCTNVSGTCLEEGHYLYECIYCGDSYKEPNGMGWSEHNFELVDYKDPTPEEDGYAVLECTWCENRMTNTVEYEPEIYQVPDAYEVAQAVVKYINQFRADQGDTQLTMLPGMTQVAEYRSMQLQSNYAHDTSDIREAHAYYEYGKWFDPTEYGNPDGEGYYSSNSREAIGRSKPGQVSVDEIGKYIAKEFNASASHWAYVGSSDYSYIGVGCYYWGGEWFTCIMVNREGIYG